ncbi:hypothetical protein TNCT_652461, partial [Trichonephila clavata]
ILTFDALTYRSFEKTDPQRRDVYETSDATSF